jgi:hypothetical protein
MKIEDITDLVGKTIASLDGFDPDSTDVNDRIYLVDSDGRGYEVTITG